MRYLKNIWVVVVFACVTHVAAQTVYTTKTGEKYHKENCRYLKYSKQDIKLDKAIQLGYEACKVCKPTAAKTKTATTSSQLATTTDNTTATKKATATQCTGKTKAGQRCKRMTKNANGRCYQH